MDNIDFICIIPNMLLKISFYYPFRYVSVIIINDMSTFASICFNKPLLEIINEYI